MPCMIDMIDMANSGIMSARPCRCDRLGNDALVWALLKQNVMITETNTEHAADV